MDAVIVLRADHDEVRALFKKVGKLDDRDHAQRKKLFAAIDAALTVHTKVEETIFYPAVKRKAENSEQRQPVLEALEEHAVAKRLIKELETLRSTDERYRAKLKVLMESVLHHASEEEKTMFPMARKLMEKAELETLGDRIDAAKKRLEAAARRGAPRSTPGVRK
jgi:hemerythrin superfamily protein